jgi:hypothetical protein
LCVLLLSISRRASRHEPQHSGSVFVHIRAAQHNESDRSGTDIFQTAVILIGIVGALGNGTVLYVFCASKQLRKQDVNVLFINQLSLDLFASFWLLVEYPVKMANIYLEGPTGYWLCIFILSEDVSYFGIFGSKLNLMSIAIERYVKIVHPIWHKNNFKSWMIYSAAVIPWAVGVFLSQSLTSLSTSVVDGQCLWGVAWINESVKYGLTTSTVIITFILPLASFLFCYSSIIFVVHRQAKIVASQRVVNPLADSYSNTHDNRLQMNALKTMIIISVAFVICWLPCDLYTMLTLFCTDVGPMTLLTYYVTLLAGFLNICVNPFIYALKYDAVKKRLFSLMGVSCYNSEPENSTSINVVS